MQAWETFIGLAPGNQCQKPPIRLLKSLWVVRSSCMGLDNFWRNEVMRVLDLMFFEQNFEIQKISAFQNYKLFQCVVTDNRNVAIPYKRELSPPPHIGQVFFF